MESLERHFDTAFESTDGINKLRDFILTLALQGKLVDQDVNDQPASELLKEIAASMRLASKKKRINQPGASEHVAGLKPPPQPQLPRGWAWITLGEIGTWKSGTTPSRAQNEYYGGNIPWVKSGEVKRGRITSTEESITEVALEKCSLSLNPVGSVLVAMYGANIGDVGILEIAAATNQAVCACQTFSTMDKRFLLLMLQFLKRNFISQGAGAAQPNISREKIISTIAPLPPASEQVRIVAKVDELMDRCDELERLREHRNIQRFAVHTAAVRKLLNLEDRDEENHTLDFLKRHFDELYTTKETIADLRKAILQLAFMGRLIPREQNDPSVVGLLKEIEAEKRTLFAQGKIKQANTRNAVSLGKVPFKLPFGWEWQRLGDLATKLHYGYTASAAPGRSGVRLLRITDIQGNSVDWETVPGCDTEANEVPQYLLNEGDILIARTGGTIGKSYLVEKLEVDAVFASYLIRVVPSVHMYARFLKYFMESPVYWRQLYAASSGTGQPNVNGYSLSNLLVPLPSRPEQNRVVTQVERMLSMCDQLAAHVDSLGHLQKSLFDALTLRLEEQQCA